MKVVRLFLAGASLALAGCQCLPWTECYCDKIDDAADRCPWFDAYYDSHLDLTRINMPDGPCCR